LNVLVIVAHPDDEVLGMGGTILRHSEKGNNVKIVYLATGITSRRKSGYKNSKTFEINSKEIKKMNKEIQNLHEDAKKACRILKVKNFKFYEFPDNEMDSVPLLKIIKIIEKEIEEIKPDLIYTHHYGDLNIDHRLVYNATLTASRPIKNSIREIICFEVPSSTEWNYPTNFVPNYFVNITNQLEKKIKSMEMYKNEIKKFPHPRSSKNLRLNAERWGSVSGFKAAEAFEVIRRLEE